MARKNRRYTSKDIIRLIFNNLTPKEVSEVVIILCDGITLEDFGEGPVQVPLALEDEGIVPTDLVLDLAFGFKDLILSTAPDIIGSLLEKFLISGSTSNQIERTLLPYFRKEN